MKKLCHYLILTTALLAMVACAPPAASPAPSGEAVSSSAPAAKASTVTAVKVDAISTDGAAAFWANAPLLKVGSKEPVEGGATGPEISVQAAYDGTSIAMRFEWADATESLLKNGWTWDGSKFSKSGDEDRVQLFWPVQNNADFASKGCTAACHSSDADKAKWWMGSESADVTYDLWHWKAARTGPVGQSDDQWVGTLEDPADMESSRHGDKKDSGGYADNLNEAKDGPAFMHSTDLAAKVIKKGEEVAIDTAKLTSGAVVPGFVIEPAVGSRGDVTASGIHADGKWVVVLVRALDTSNGDDVTFSPPKAYPFGLAVTDDGGGTDHTVVPDVLTLEWQ